MKKKENYFAPEIEFFEVAISGILCQSGLDDNLGSTNEGVGEENWTL